MEILASVMNAHQDLSLIKMPASPPAQEASTLTTPKTLRTQSAPNVMSSAVIYIRFIELKSKRYVTILFVL
jgi:hypothetical protein